MTESPVRPRCALLAALTLGSLLLAAPASAQWTRVTAVPVTDVFTVWANADTIAAGVDSVAYVSTDAGVTWKRSTMPTAAVQVIDALWVRNGRIYLGTFGQGVFVSDDLGDTWQPYNEGLTGGFLDSQLDVGSFAVRGDSLYAGTLGAGVYVRGFAAGSAWRHFGEVFEPDQASNIIDVAAGADRLLASAGSNGMVFVRDPGDAEWTESFLDNVGLAPSLSALAAVRTGAGWIVGTNAGVFQSPLGESPWSFVDVGLGGLSQVALAERNGQAFAAFVTPNLAAIESSGDGGATWQLLESQAHVFVFRLAATAGGLYAARADGLWLRATGSVAVAPGDPLPRGLRFALAGGQPIGDSARLRFELPAPGPVAIDVYDVRGRRVGDRVAGTFGAGAQEVAWSARGVRPGVYLARLSAAGRAEVVRLVRLP